MISRQPRWLPLLFAASAFLIPGNVDDDDALLTANEKQQFQEAGTLVVEQVLPPVADDQLWNEDGNVAVFVVALFGEDVVQNRQNHGAVGGLEPLEFRFRQAGGTQGLEDLLGPHIGQFVRAVIVVGRIDVNDLQIVRDGHGKAEGFGGEAAPAIHGDDDDGWMDICGLQGFGAGCFLGNVLVVAMDGGHGDDEDCNEEDGDPGALGKFGHQHHHGGDAGGNGADAVDEHSKAGARLSATHPVDDHAGLGKREGHERADGVERDEAIGDAAEEDEQGSGEEDEDVDAQEYSSRRPRRLKTWGA